MTPSGRDVQHRVTTARYAPISRDLGHLAAQHAEHDLQLLVSTAERLATHPASPPWNLSADISLRCPRNSDSAHVGYRYDLDGKPGGADLPRLDGGHVRIRQGEPAELAHRLGLSLSGLCVRA